jgi:hypothetical protein
MPLRTLSIQQKAKLLWITVGMSFRKYPAPIDVWGRTWLGLVVERAHDILIIESGYVLSRHS